MAARVPVVVSDTGGLSEIVEHDKTGVKTFPNDSDSLAWGITRLLKDPSYADTIRRNAYQKIVEDYNWDKIANEMTSIYNQVATSIQPRPATVPEVPFPLPGFEKYPTEFRLLLVMHVLGVATREKAKSVNELSQVLGMGVVDIHRLLEELLKLGYVESCRDRSRRVLYYLTQAGITKACSLFS